MTKRVIVQEMGNDGFIIGEYANLKEALKHFTDEDCLRNCEGVVDAYCSFSIYEKDAYDDQDGDWSTNHYKEFRKTRYGKWVKIKK